MYLSMGKAQIWVFSSFSEQVLAMFVLNFTYFDEIMPRCTLTPITINSNNNSTNSNDCYIKLIFHLIFISGNRSCHIDLHIK